MLKRLNLGNERVATRIVLGFIGISLILKLINVFNAPANWDTGMYLNIAVGYFERGILTPLMWRFNPEWNIITGSGSGYAIYLIIGWVKLFGISVLSGHLLMYLLGLINLPVIYLVGKRLYDSHEAGIWVMAFFALSSTFAQDFYVRMDAVNILACSLLLLLHLEAVRRDKWWLHFIMGVALVAALEVHILAAIYAGGIGLYYAVNYLKLAFKQKRIILNAAALPFGIGLVLAAVVYYLHHIAPNPDLYFMIPRYCNLCVSLTPFKEIERWYKWFGQQPFALIMLVLGVVFAVRRRLPTDAHYLLLLGGGYIAFLMLNPPASDVYTGHMLPLLALGIGGLFEGLARGEVMVSELRAKGIVLAVTAIVVLLLGTYFTYARAYISPLLMYYAGINNPQDYRDAINYIRANIPTDTVIVGHETYYLDLLEYHNYISLRGIGELGVKQRNETYFDLWQREKPQVFMADVTDRDVLPYVLLRGDFVQVVPNLWIARALVKP
jgi:hypothetical protein